jgi:hypothetical protein
MRRNRRSGLQIFINYRRADTRHVAGRLRDFIQASCQACEVFMDVEDIEPGLDYVTALTRAVGTSDVLLVLIGEQWLAQQDATGARRIDDPADRLRIEIEAGLANQTRVIPVLVDGARMPLANDLPPSLAQLARHHAIRVSHESFRPDAAHLLGAVRKGVRADDEATDDVEHHTSRVARWLAGGLLLVAALALVALRDPASDLVAARGGVPPEGPWASVIWLLPAVPALAATLLIWSQRHLGVALGCLVGAIVWVGVSFTHVRYIEAPMSEHVVVLALLLAGLAALMTAVPAAWHVSGLNRPSLALLALALVLVAVALRLQANVIAAMLTSTELTPTDWSALLDRPAPRNALLIPLLIGLPAAVLACNRMQVRALATLAGLQVLYPVVLRSISFFAGTGVSDVPLAVVSHLVFVIGSLCMLLAVYAGQRDGTTPRRFAGM